VDIVVAFLVLFFIQTLWERLVMKTPPSLPEETKEDFQKRGFVEAVFGIGQARIIAYSAVMLLGLLQGKWWLGLAAIAFDLILGVMVWFVYINRKSS
jgi:hypothetical protein